MTTLNPIKILKRYDPISGLLLYRNGEPSKMIKLQREGEFAKDLTLGKTYGPLRGCTPIQGDKGLIYPFDGETGAPINLRWSSAFTELSTDPLLLHRMTDKSLLANILDLEMRWGTTLIFGAMTAAVSWAICASIY